MAKSITCRDMGGVCDAAITADTVEEMKEKGKAHVHEAGDEEHGKVIEKMKSVTPEEMKEWDGMMEKKFEEAPEA